jgi:hypothetical protein
MRAILPLHPGVIHQPQVGFIDQSARLEAVARPLTPHVPMGETVELCVHDGRQLVERPLVSVAP